jgi:hypothetical protein
MNGTASGEPSLPPPFSATIIGGTEKLVQFKSYYFEGKKMDFITPLPSTTCSSEPSELPSELPSRLPCRLPSLPSHRIIMVWSKKEVEDFYSYRWIGIKLSSYYSILLCAFRW